MPLSPYRHGHGQCLGASAELVGFARDLAGGHAHMLRGGARGPLRHRAPRRCACRWRGSLPGRVSRLMTGGWRLLHRQRQRHRPRHGCLQLRNRRLCVRLGAAMNRPGITLRTGCPLQPHIFAPNISNGGAWPFAANPLAFPIMFRCPYLEHILRLLSLLLPSRLFIQSNMHYVILRVYYRVQRHRQMLLDS